MLDPAGEVAKPVEGGLIGPVEVLHHDAGGSGGLVEMGEEPGEEVVAVALVTAEVLQSATHGPGDLVQRAQGARREAPVTGAPQPPQVAREERKTSTRDVFPTPTSPATTTNRPWPEAASPA